MKDLCIVILNYRRGPLTIGCLESIADELATEPSWCAVVVDNGSDDDSADQIAAAIAERGWGENITLIRSPVNGGFAAGNNRGFEAVQAEHYMLLNSDARATPGAIRILLETLRQHPTVGMTGPRLQDPDGTPQISCFRYRTPISEFLTAAGTGVLDRWLSRWVVATRVYDAPARPEWLSFACIMIRREVIEQVGPMDEGYFMYFEDIDYSRQVRRAGWDILHQPAARVIHLRGGTSSVKAAIRDRTRIPQYYFQARSRYFARFYGGVFGLWFTNAMWMLGRGVSFIRELFGKKRPHTARGEASDNWFNWLRPMAPPPQASGGDL